jgi:hypothetical protein
MGYYVLDDDNNVVAWPDQKMLKWAMILEDLRRDGRTIVKQEFVDDCVWVSTVFLGLDHNYVNRIRFEHPEYKGEPHIFETMAFDRREGDEELGEDLECSRWSTWNEALEGHKDIVNRIGMSIKLNTEGHS